MNGRSRGVVAQRPATWVLAVAGERGTADIRRASRAVRGPALPSAERGASAATGRPPWGRCVAARPASATRPMRRA
jgi:hypothetical protein